MILFILTTFPFILLQITVEQYVQWNTDFINGSIGRIDSKFVSQRSVSVSSFILFLEVLLIIVGPIFSDTPSELSLNYSSCTVRIYYI